MIRQFGEIRKSETDDRTVQFVFSTSAKDRHRTVLNQEGWMLENFNRNGIAGYMHDVYGDGLLAKPDPDDVIGKARAWVEGDNLMGEIAFEPADLNEKADKVYRKIQFGSLNAVSVGFVEKGAGEMGRDDDGQDPDAYYFAGQELLEISVVNIPSNPEALKSRDFTPWNSTRTDEIQTDLKEQVINKNQMEEKKNDLPETSKVDVNVKVDATEIAEAVNKMADVVEKMNKPENIPGAVSSDISDHDKKDLGKYRIGKAIYKQFQAQQGHGKLDGIELEMHQEAIEENKKSGAPISGLGVPSLIHSRADLKATVDAAGGYTVATELPGFIDTLKNSMVSLQAGAQLWTGLEGDISIPRAASNSVATWRSEGGIATQSDPTFEAVTMSPNRLTTYTEYTQQLLKQSTNDIEGFIRENLYYSIANALETAVYEGDGASNQPTGILNATGVGDATHGSSNPTVCSWANIVNMEKHVAVDNALKSGMAYVMKSTAAAKMKVTTKSDYQGGYIWESFAPIAPKGMVNGYDSYVTNVFTDDTVIFGNFADLIVGQWGGGLDLLVNPYSLDTYATIRVVVAGYYDLAVKHGQSFSRIDDLVVA